MAKSKNSEAKIEFKAVTTEFNAGIKLMNSSLLTLNNELKLNSTQLKGNADDVDLLQERQRILQNQLQASAQKVEYTNQSLQAAKEKLGENSKEYQNLNNQLLRAKTQQQAIQNELNQTNSKLDAQAQSADDTGDAINELANDLDDAGDSALNFKDMLEASVVGNVIADGIGNIKDGIAGLIDGIKELSVGSESSFNQLIAKTGATESEFEELEQIMNDIYANNFGESFDDIAESMAQVYQQTGLSGDALRKTTENALLLRDTFDFEVNESIRAVDMLMTQFGLTSEESFNLIAQGAQMGLDKNGDLLDTINEYSVHFKDAGYSAEEMFNSLKNGTEAGTFSVDKLGDAVKEFGIRMKDGSANDAIKELGLNVDDVTKRFAQGGETAADAMGEVTDALFTLEDPLKKNELGVAMFGTMFEDLGATGVAELMYIGGEADRTANTLNDINNIRYNDLESAFEGIKRNIEVQAIQPIKDKLLPALSDLANNGDFSIFADGVTLAMDGISTGLTFIVENKDVFLSLAAGITGAATAYALINGVVSAYIFIMPIYTAVTTGASLSTTALGGAIAFLKNPITIAAVAIGSLIAVGVLLWQNWDTIEIKCGELKEGVINKFTELKNGAINKFNELKSGIINKVNETKTNAVNKFNELKNGAINKFNELKSGIINKVNETKTNAVNKFNELKNGAINKISEMKTNAVNKFNDIKQGISNKINGAKDSVKNAIDKMKGFFNFSWSLPKIKLPHFKVSGSSNPINWLSQGVPKISVEWYKNGGIMTNPTMFGLNGNKAMIGGEAGPEAILPISILRQYVREEMKGVMRENSNNLEVKLNIEHFNNNSQYDIDSLLDTIVFEIQRRIF